ncbi:MAG: hypothetical protein JXR77_18420, partial [Lentisphaeria bacterium]|nr:hypothetical protein [Lentisphaeria bacterium]
MRTIAQRLAADVRRPPPAADATATLLRTQRPDGSWPQVDYADQGRMSWAPSRHMGELLSLACAYAGTEAGGPSREALAKAIGRGLDFWFAKDPQCPNWWYNQIGVPRQLYRVMLLVNEILTPDQRR